jgi:2-methylisocitrate lyase-like PEP mutase family enzyme
MALAHLHEMVAAVDLPINADFENGFAPDAAGVAESVRLAVATGVAGLSIEDSTGDAEKSACSRSTRRSNACVPRAAPSTGRVAA